MFNPLKDDGKFSKKMNDYVDVECYLLGEELILLAHSHTSDGCVVAEFPPERISLAVDDTTLGQLTIHVAEKCRGMVNDIPTQHDARIKALGFKSDRDMYKKTEHVGISRRNGSSNLSISPSRKEKGYNLYTDTNFEAPINNASEIGKAVREALALSIEMNVSV